MPVIISCEDKEKISLDEFVTALYEKKTNPSCQSSLMEAAIDLKRLSNNKTFLGEFIAEEIKNYKGLQSANTYSSQVIMLHPPSEKSTFFIRANIWPSKKDYLTLINGEDAFFYHKPHDHNFNFLTVGYLGPGYWSDYFEYDYEDVVGFPGENVDLKFIERSSLNEGKVMLYRAHKDVHDQLPADEFSISLNIMENSLASPMLDQYAFDVKKSKIKSVINSNSTKALFDIAIIGGDGNSIDIIDHIAKFHLVDRVRLNAIEAIAKSFTTAKDVYEHYEKYKDDRSDFIKKNIAIRVKEFEGLK